MRLKGLSKFAGCLLLPPFALLSGCSLSRFPLLDPAGPIGHDEYHLIVIAFLLMLIPVIPVIVMTFWFARHYRAGNTQATYKPRWGHSNRIEAVIWSIPVLIVVALSVLSWITTHELDPYKPLTATASTPAAAPVQIEAISLDWKWLFIYPQEHIATVNELVFPVDTPLSFKLTSDAVMTSFFIPRLGTQIYAMAGMNTDLHLIANRTGTFTGWNSQLSGDGFSGMHFEAIATTRAGYRKWLERVRAAHRTLDRAAFLQLEKPSEDNPVAYYSAVRPDDLFRRVIDKYRLGGGHDSALAQVLPSATR